jgi:hypothetical protein
MAKKPRSPPAPPAKRPRGRPPKPGGPIPQAEIQRAYRARLAAAGKVVRLVAAASVARQSKLDTRDNQSGAALTSTCNRQSHLLRIVFFERTPVKPGLSGHRLMAAAGLTGAHSKEGLQPIGVSLIVAGRGF